jgi:hypothetical protein
LLGYHSEQKNGVISRKERHWRKRRRRRQEKMAEDPLSDHYQMLEELGSMIPLHARWQRLMLTLVVLRWQLWNSVQSD